MLDEPLTDKDGEVRDLKPADFAQARPVQNFPEIMAVLEDGEAVEL